MKFLSVHDLLKQYLEEGRIKVDKSIHQELTTYHDPCNYGRKSERTFGHGYYEEPRWITQQCCENFVDMYPNRANNFCCGAGGARMWQEEKIGNRINHNRVTEIVELGVDRVATACPFCLTMISDGLKDKNQEQIQALDIAEIVAESLSS